jgi:cytochrome c biogenesis protein CcmG/thiol:disulfide interchange protein DsbE
LVERELPKLEVAGSTPVVRLRSRRWQAPRAASLPSVSPMKRLSPFAVLAIVGVVALVGLLAYGLVASEPDQGMDDALARGETIAAPGFDLDRLSGGGRQMLDDYRGKVVVLNAWASWCKPCREESPLLQRWHERLERAGAGTVLGVNALDVDSDARAFVREYGLTYPMLRDPEAGSLVDYGVIGYPETFVIDPRGRIVALKRGVVDDRWMREHVAPLLEPS